MTIKKKYGSYLKALRNRAGMTMDELAARTNLSPSFISKLESGKVGISVSNLENIVSAFGLGADYLVRDRPEHPVPSVVRRNRGDRFILNANQLYERVGPDDPHFGLACALVRSYSGETSGEMTAHLGAEFYYILQGSFRFLLGESVYELKAGDTLSHTSDLPHCWENIDSEEGIFLIVSTMPFN